MNIPNQLSNMANMSVEKITDQTRSSDHFALLMLVTRGLGKLLAEGRILAALHALVPGDTVVAAEAGCWSGLKSNEDNQGRQSDEDQKVHDDKLANLANIIFPSHSLCYYAIMSCVTGHTLLL